MGKRGRPKRIRSALNERAFQKLLKSHTQADVARMVNLSKQAINAWSEVPPKFVKKISEITGIPREELNPELFS